MCFGVFLVVTKMSAVLLLYSVPAFREVLMSCLEIVVDLSSYLCCFFFFSSRRRHTRYWRDWSSDVCSSDLISKVKDEDVANRTLTSAEEALQGKTSGVQVITTSGMPGSVPSIRVRGYSSNSDMSPLYVVDGIIMNDISSIDVSDIASMEVLKDAASAAIYGAQAGNGVVLITTKSGKKSADNWGRITYDFQYSSNSLAHKPKLMNAKEYAEFMVEAGSFSQTTVDAFWDGKTNTEWLGEVYEPTTMLKHNLSFSSGNDRGSVYVSAGYLTDRKSVV